MQLSHFKDSKFQGCKLPKNARNHEKSAHGTEVGVNERTKLFLLNPKNRTFICLIYIDMISNINYYHVIV